MKIKGIKIAKSIAKLLLGALTTVVILFLLIKIVLLVPSVQNGIKTKVASALHKKLNSEVSVGKIDIKFPKKLSVDEFLVATEKKDTLVFLGNFSVSFKVFPLLKHRIVLNEISLNNSKGDFGKLLDRIPTESSAITDEETSEASPWEIEVNSLKFETCHFEYRDNSEEGFELILDFGKVSADLGYVNLDTLIRFSSLKTEDSYVSYQNLSTIESESDSLFSFADIRIDKTNLVNSGFSYIDSSNAVVVNISTGELKINDLLVDITGDDVSINKGNTDNLFVEILQLPNKDTLPKTNDYLNWGESLTDWNFEGNELKVKDTRVKIESVVTPNTPGHFNGDHLDFNDLNGTLADFSFANNIIELEFQKFSGKEMNGFEIEQLDAEIHTTPDEFRIDKFNLKTTAADYDIQLLTTMSPTNYLDIEGKTLILDLEIESKSWQDIDYFSPILKENTLLTKDFSNNPFRLQTKISGKTEDLSIELFDFSYLKSTRISASGQIKNLTTPDYGEYLLDLKNLYVSQNDFNKTFNPFLPDSVFTFPQFVRLNGRFNGNKEFMKFTGKIMSDIGTIDLYDLNTGFGKNKNYEARISVDLKHIDEVFHLDLNRLKLDLKGSFSGHDMYSSLASLQLDVDTAIYRGHAYNNLKLFGESDSGIYNVHLSSLDSSLFMEADVSGGYYENEKTGRLTMNLKNIDLKKLNLLEDDFRLDGNTSLNVAFDSITNFKTSLNLENLNFYFSDTIYRMHPIEIESSSNAKNTTLKLESFFYNLDYQNSGNWKKMVSGIAHLPRRYFDEEKKDTILNEIPEFSLKGHLEYPEAFARLFFPDLPSFRSLTINGNYSEATDKLYFGFELPELEKDGFRSDSLIFSLNGNSEELNFNGSSSINVNDILTGELSFTGSAKNAKLNSVLQYFDSYEEKYLGLNTLLWSDSKEVFVHLIPDSLIFSYDRWQINPDNQVKISSENISFSGFELESEAQKITINSGKQNSKDFIRLQLVDFGMGSIENLLALDTLVYGTANADFIFNNVFTNPVIDGQLAIENMNIYDFDFGKLDISQFYYDKNELDYQFSLVGEKEHLESSGKLNFNAGPGNINAELEIKKLELSELGYMFEDYIFNPKGILESNLKIAGTFDDPVFDGYVKFKEAGVGVNILNEYFTIGNEPIAFNNSSVHFNNLKITNANGRTANLNGTVSLDPKSPGMQNLVFSTDNMELLNTKVKDNDLYYGFLKAQTTIQLTGQRNALKVDAKTKIDKNTNITYIFPDVLTMNDNKGIVTFGEYSPDSTDISAYEDEQDMLKSLSLESIKAAIEVEPGTRFKIYFDETKSDFLDAVLNGNISYNLNGDNSEISGTMALVEGKLRYSLPMVSVKDYIIEPGSSIIISNDVYNPYLNIVASTTVRASTEKLIEDYVKVMNFTVLLKMSGELNNMKLEFDISPETEDVLVSSKLSSLSVPERNVNALNLLVRGSFTITLKGDEVGTTSTTDAALDKFYTEQLNHLISDNVNFVDINFDVQSFSDYGQYGEAVKYRNYYYNVGKSFFNNRARINYKGSFDFSNQTDQSLNSQFLQDELNLEIGLTDDGTWKALFYNRNTYEGILEGKIMETGGGIKLHKEFYSIGDIFDGNEKRKEKRRIKKQEKENLKIKETEEKK